MLTTLIRRELLDNLMTFRFAAAVFITLLLVVANTFVLIRDYEQRLADYNTALKTHRQQLLENKTYSAIDLQVDRPPNPLSLFNVGLDKQLGNQVEVYYGFVPTLWDATKHGSTDSFMGVFSSIDIVFIFEVVLSLMALIFAYDALAGEYEGGTLRLVLTHPVSRGQILLGKYISAMVCLLVPLLMSLLLAVILLTTSTSIALNTDDFLRISGIVLTSIVYLSVFYLIGLLISVLTRRTSTALMLAMFVWGFLVLVYPNMILGVLPPPETLQKRAASPFSQIEQMWEAFDRERKQFLKNDDFPGEDSSFKIMGPGWSSEGFSKSLSSVEYFYRGVLHAEALKDGSEPQVFHAQNYYGFLGPRVTDTAEKTWLIRKPALEKIYVQPANMEKVWLKLSPVGLYDASTQAWAGTDLKGIQDFFEAAREYRRKVVDHFYNQKVFGTRQWFAGDKGTADWDSLPQFFFQRADVDTNATRALPDVYILLILNGIIFIVIFLIFIKSEV